MKQHTIKDVGPPLFPPDSISQHYVNVTTGDVYISFGNSSVSDWGQPIVKSDNLDATVRELLNELSGGESVELLRIVEVKWDAVDAVKRATIALPIAVGSLVRVVDYTNRPGSVQLKLDRSNAGALREGMKVPVLNSTGSELIVYSNNINDTIDYAGHRVGYPYVLVDGYVTIRFLGERNMGFHYIVTGDTNRTVSTDDVNVVTHDTYDNTLDAMTRVFVDASNELDLT